MLDKAKIFLKEIDKLKESFKEFCQNKSIDIEDRWEVFEQIGAFFGVDEWSIVDFKSLPEEFIMYDGDMHTERYQTVNTVNIIQYIEECSEDNSEFSGINIDEVKEEILDKFLWSFVYDW